jgi:hypothetical protein
MRGSSPNKKAIGAAIVVVGLGMLTGLWYALLTLGIFLFIWGQKPAWVYDAIKKLPSGQTAADWLLKLDDLIEGAAETRVDPAIVSALQVIYQKGAKIREASNDSSVFNPLLLKWETEAINCLKQSVPSEAFSFEHCHDNMSGEPRLSTKLKKLRIIIQRLENS